MNGEALPVSEPMAGDLSRPPFAAAGDREPQVTLGFSARDAGTARRFIGSEARLVTHLANPGVELGRLRILKVDEPKALLVGEILPRS
jgi:hypothetical protein